MISFLLPFLFASTAVVGPIIGGVFSFSSVFVALVAFPVIDAFMKPDSKKSVIGPPWFFNGILYVYTLTHCALICWGVFEASRISSNEPMDLTALIGLTFSIGIISGSLGVTFAHELIHRKSRFERFLGEVILVFVGFGHFAVAHVYVHHRNVGTPEDPTTAKKGQSIYAFYLQSIPGVFISAFQIKPMRIIVYTFLTTLIGVVIYFNFGAIALAFFVAQGFLAILLTEAADYIEHYGIERKMLPTGRFEPIGPSHSWDSDRWLTGKVMIHLQRHSDHHMHASKHYQDLELKGQAKQLPSGYAGCLLLALVPPIWRKIMDPKI